MAIKRTMQVGVRGGYFILHIARAVLTRLWPHCDTNRYPPVLQSFGEGRFNAHYPLIAAKIEYYTLRMVYFLLHAVSPLGRYKLHI